MFSKYSPTKVLMIALHDLHECLTYQALYNSQIEANIQDKAELSDTITFYRFLRENDQQCINYATVAKDDDNQNYPYATIDKVLTFFKFLLDKQCVALTDITIIPVVQIKVDRKISGGKDHFTTLVMYMNQVYYLEPRANSFFYPIIDLQNKFSLFNSFVTYQHLCVGSQEWFDDASCGLHHLNYVQAMADECTKDSMANPDVFKDKLYNSKYDLKNRKNDPLKLQTINEILNAFDIRANAIAALKMQANIHEEWRGKIKVELERQSEIDLFEFPEDEFASLANIKPTSYIEKCILDFLINMEKDISGNRIYFAMIVQRYLNNMKNKSESLFIIQVRKVLMPFSIELSKQQDEQFNQAINPHLLKLCQVTPDSRKILDGIIYQQTSAEKEKAFNSLIALLNDKLLESCGCQYKV